MKYHQKINRIHVVRQTIQQKIPIKIRHWVYFPRDIPYRKNPLKTHQPPWGYFPPWGEVHPYPNQPPTVGDQVAPNLLSNWLGHWHPKPGEWTKRKRKKRVSQFGNQLEMLTSWKLNWNSLRIKYIYIYMAYIYMIYKCICICMYFFGMHI